MILPIWKDKIVTLSGGDSASFRIRSVDEDDKVIYSGKAHRRPDALAVTARINDIIADYIAGADLFSTEGGDFSPLRYPLTFAVDAYINGAWTEVDSNKYVNDWSYDYDHDPERDGISAPITGRISPNFPFITSVLDADSARLDVYRTDGTHSFQIVPIVRKADFGPIPSGDDKEDFSVDFAITNMLDKGTGVIAFDLSIWGDDIAYVEVDGHRYDIVPSCLARHALYYINAYGGWDFLTLENLHFAQFDVVGRRERKVEYDNSTPSARGRENWVNELTKCYTLHTGNLTDEQSAKMHHLLNSTCVYLYDSEDATMRPVVLTDTETLYKTFRNLGGRELIQYTINAELAQDMTRR